MNARQSASFESLFGYGPGGPQADGLTQHRIAGRRKLKGLLPITLRILPFTILIKDIAKAEINGRISRLERGQLLQRVRGVPKPPGDGGCFSPARTTGCIGRLPADRLFIVAGDGHGIVAFFLLGRSS